MMQGPARREHGRRRGRHPAGQGRPGQGQVAPGQLHRSRRPITGTILTKKAEKGNIVNPIAFNISASLCDMADLSDLEVDLNIQERDVAKVFKGQRCAVRARGLSRPRSTKGYVVCALMPIADRAKGAIPVRVKVLSMPKDEEGEIPQARHGRHRVVLQEASRARKVLPPACGLAPVSDTCATRCFKESHGRRTHRPRVRGPQVLPRGSEQIDVLKDLSLEVAGGRVPGADGAQRLGQDDPAQPDRRPGQAQPGRDPGRRPADLRHERGAAGALADPATSASSSSSTTCCRC